MKKQNVLGLVLATSLALTSLAGCKTPNATTIAPGGQQATTGQQTTGGTAAKPTTGGQATGAAQQSAATESKSDGTADVLAEEQEMDDLDFMAGQETAAAGYAVLMLGQERPGPGEVAITATGDAGAVRGDAGARAEVRAELLKQRREKAMNRAKELREKAHKAELRAEVKAKLETRKAEKEAKVKARLDKMADARAKLREKAKGGAWVDNGDGTETKSFSFAQAKSLNGKSADRSVEMSRTRHKEGKHLISSVVKFTQSLPSGLSRSSERTKTLQEDGSYKVVFHAEHTFPDGTKRVADWEKTIAVDGTVTGTGTIVWTDKDGNEVKKVEVTLKGSDEAPVADAGGETVTPEEAPAEETATEEAEATEAEETEATEEAEATEAEEAEATEEADATEEAQASA